MQELEVGIIKNMVRVLLESAKVPLHYWPLALRQASEQRFRGQLRSFGLQYPRLLPFGARGVARVKTWRHRAQPWKFPKQRVTILGPAEGMSSSSGGYWVVGEDGKGFRSTAVTVPKFKASIADGLQKIGEPAPEDDYEPSEMEDMNGRELEKCDEEDFRALVEGEVAVEVEVPVENPQPVQSAKQAPKYRMKGKQPMGEVRVPAPKYRATGKQPLGAVRMVQADGYVECNQCGLLQPQAPRLQRCGYCEAECPAKVAGGETLQMACEKGLEHAVSFETLKEDLRQNVQESLRQLHHFRVGQGAVEEIQRLGQIERAYEHVMKGLLELWREEKPSNSLHVHDGEGECSVLANETLVQIRALQGEQEKLTGEINEKMKLLSGVETETVLQTYTVSAKEVRQEAEKWVPSIEEEINQLVNTNTIRRRSAAEVKQLEGLGKPVERIPGKLVHTRKAPVGKRRSRIVACGNYMVDQLHDESTSAGGIDSISIRLLTRLSSEWGWKIGSVDVKGAFLNAPRRATSQKVTLVVPPRLLVDLKLVAPDEYWEITGALYGLQESPRDWGCHRDEVLQGTKWMYNDVRYYLEQTEEMHLWRVRADGDSGSSPHGFLATYVDDILVTAPDGLAQALLEHLRTLWQCSPAEVASWENPMRFCGYELRETQHGYLITQQNYIRDMCGKHGIESGGGIPASLFKDLGSDETEIDSGTLREAQQLVGEMQWVATRTRPDVTYHLGVMSRLMHRRPKKVVALGMELMRYLAETADFALHYKRCSSLPSYGMENHLAEKEGINKLSVFVDSSFALEHEQYRSIQGLVLCVGGAPIAWASSRQPFVAASTAESELVGYVESQQCAESLASLMTTVGLEDVSKCLYGDSKSALHLLTAETGHWRTRHLRIRSAKLRDTLRQDPSWQARHMAGEALVVADGVTKPLQGQRFLKFIKALQLESLQETSKKVEGDNESKITIAKLMVGGWALMETMKHDYWMYISGVGLILLGIWLYGKLIGRWGREDEPPPESSAGLRMIQAELRAPEPTRHKSKRRSREHEPLPRIDEEGAGNMNRSQSPVLRSEKDGVGNMNHSQSPKDGVGNMNHSQSPREGREHEPPSTPFQSPNNCPSGLGLTGTAFLGLDTDDPCHGSEGDFEAEAHWSIVPPSNENEREYWRRRNWFWNGQGWCTAVGSNWWDEEVQGEGDLDDIDLGYAEGDLEDHDLWHEGDGIPRVRMLAMDEDAEPWNGALQQPPPGKHDKWMIWPMWVCRVHGASRQQPFLPLHASFPLTGGSEELTGERVTVIFCEGQQYPMVYKDNWHDPPSTRSRQGWKDLGPWRGYTLLRRSAIPMGDLGDPIRPLTRAETSGSVPVQAKRPPTVVPPEVPPRLMMSKRPPTPKYPEPKAPPENFDPGVGSEDSFAPRLAKAAPRQPWWKAVDHPDVEPEDRDPLPSYDEPWHSEAWQREIRKMPLCVAVAFYREWLLHNYPKLTDTQLEDMMEHWQTSLERELGAGPYVPDLRIDQVSPVPTESPQSSSLDVHIGKAGWTSAKAYPNEVRATWPNLAQNQMNQESSSGTTSGPSTSLITTSSSSGGYQQGQPAERGRIAVQSVPKIRSYGEMAASSSSGAPPEAMAPMRMVKAPPNVGLPVKAPPNVGIPVKAPPPGPSEPSFESLDGFELVGEAEHTLPPRRP